MPFRVTQLMKAQIDDLRPLFLRELRLAVVASWRTIPCTSLYDASIVSAEAVCDTFLGPLVSYHCFIQFCCLIQLEKNEVPITATPNSCKKWGNRLNKYGSVRIYLISEIVTDICVPKYDNLIFTKN